jgi:calcium/calmodulin-dependent protein kinase I
VAPEILLEKPYSKAVDLWSIGIIAYLLLTGCLPFDDENSQREIARKTISESLPLPDFLWKDISYEAKDFVTSILEIINLF